MGLLDSVLGGVTGSSHNSSSPTSPMIKALMLLLAAKAASSYMGGGSSADPAGKAPHHPEASGGSGTVQSGILKGIPSLDSLLERFTHSGQADKFQSWVGPGENHPLRPDELQKALGPGELDHLQKETGLPRDQLLSQLSKMLPQAVDKLTPQGRMPTQEERSRW